MGLIAGGGGGNGGGSAVLEAGGKVEGRLNFMLTSGSILKDEYKILIYQTTMKDIFDIADFYPLFLSVKSGCISYQGVSFFSI